LLDENRSEQAIIIIDMINNIAHPNGENYASATKEIIPLVQGELKYFRERMQPVIFCNTKKNSLFNQQIIHELSPHPQEVLLLKKSFNAFFETNLLKVLHENRVKSLTIVGVFTHESILRTVASALDHGFSVVVPETCTCSKTPEDQEAALLCINRWLSQSA